jgi:uncharacterized protein involved in outer membrane biogenesis
LKRYVILAVLVVYTATAYYLPTVSAGWRRDQFLSAMENSLGRKVEIGNTNLRLFPDPAFEVADVRIGEDPQIGPETAAYIDTLVARPSILALLTGKLRIGSVTLEDASLNLTRIDNEVNGVRWNFALLATKKATSSSSDFPAIHMSGARVNFKFGDTKSIFYLHDTYVDLSPSAIRNGSLKIRVSGQPARTDRVSRGFGSFVAEGQWNSADHSLELNAKLEKSELSDVLSLFGQSTLLGNVWGDAHLAGPMSKIGITGRLNVSDLHGWNQLPPGGSAIPFSIGGTLDVPGQVLDLHASGAEKNSPISAGFHVAGYLGRPKWAGEVTVKDVPVAPLTSVARNFGIALPQDLKLDGVAEGSVGYSNASGTPGMDGGIRVSNATLSAQGAPPLKIARADVSFTGSSIALSPTSIVNDANESADIDGEYETTTGELQVSLTSTGMSIASLRRQVSVAGVPLIGLATGGNWSGSLRYGSGRWAGDIQLKDTDVPFEAFAQPIHVVQADASLDDAGAVLKHVDLTVGGIEATGEYRYEIGLPHPHRFRLSVVSASAADLETMLLPALKRGNILTYAFNFGRAPQPGWLVDMHAEGAIQIGSLTIAGTPVSNLRSNLVWDGTEVSLTGLSGRVADSPFSGTAKIHLAARQPRYEVTGNLSGFAWQGGTLTAIGGFHTSGTGSDLLTNLRAEGTFTGKKLEVATLNPWDSVEGKFDFSIVGATPRLHLSGLTVQSAGTKWTGVADTQDSGQTVFRLADGSRHLEASGALLKGEALKPLP